MTIIVGYAFNSLLLAKAVKKQIEDKLGYRSFGFVEVSERDFEIIGELK